VLSLGVKSKSKKVNVPTLAEIRDTVDARLATLGTAIQSREDTYAAAHNGRYWQGIRTHSITPADGNTALPDIGTTCPTDQLGVPWPVAIRNTAIEMALQIDVYDGPLGVGYQATVYVTVLGNTYFRTQQVGPETWRQRGWAQVGV
jgi:hypothetical protein